MVAKKRSKGVASLNPDNMASAGLADDFDGEITKARFVPWNYGNTRDTYVLAAAVTIQPDEESGFDEFVQYYSAGDLELFVPSVDGSEAVDLEGWDEEDLEDVEGIYAYQVGRREQLSNSSNFADFISKLVAAGFSANIEANIDFLEGISGHFNRVPQRKRSGIVSTDSEDRQKTILVLTEIAETKAASKPKGRGKAKGKAASGSDDLTDEVSEAIVAAISDAGGELPKRKLAGVIIKAFKGSKSKSAAVKMASDTSFLAESDLWTYDEDEGVLYEA